MTPALTSPGARRLARRWRIAIPVAISTVVSSLVLIVPFTTANAADTLISQGKPATASSVQGADLAAANAVDGNAGSRWGSQWSDPQWLQVDLQGSATISQVVLQWEGAYGTAFQIQTSNDAVNWTSIYSTTTGTGGTQTLNVTGSGRYVRMYGTARNSGYGYSLYEFKVIGSIGGTNPSPSAGACGTTNIAQGKTATASSVEVGSPAEAVDGNTGTRWGSLFADPQWLRVDLGQSYSICKVELVWEAAYATAFQIQTSPDGSNWTSVYSTTTGTGGTQSLGLSGTGRYLRMYGTTRVGGYGYSLWELRVFAGGTPTSPSASPSTTPNTSPSPSGNWTTVWEENFDGAANTSPSAANWLLRTGTQYPGGAANWGTGEIETASASTANVYLTGDGKLNIKAIRDGAGNWTSGRLETQRTDFTPAAGELTRFSAVIQQPNPANGLGYWPAFRATGAAYRGNYNNWPGVGETDIMSGVNGRSQLSNTLHCGTAPDGPCGEYNGRTSGLASCQGCQTAFHEYAQVIDRTKTDEEIRFYLDGVQTYVVRESQVGVAAWDAAVHHGFYLRLDLAIGGLYPNAIAGETVPTPATTSGGVLAVDKVTVSRQAGTAAPAMTDPAVPAGPSVVKVTGTQGNWQLQVNGASYLVKGLTYGPPQGAGDGYMRDLKNMGVNTIRTWGVDDAATPGLLDTAARFGIKVIVGHWLNQGADYVNDTAYKTSVKAEIVARVNALKNRQGVLMWDVGNEVLLTMQDHGLPAAEVEARRNAYAAFVNEVAVAIHAADPNHPVTSTDAWVGAWPYYKNNAPNLDLWAINSYGAIGGVKQAWINGGYNKPYVVTEGGPDGEWEVPNDINGVPTEPTDVQKKAGYTASWNAILSHPGVALGATEFHYGLENDFGGVWLNTLTGGWRRLGYHALKQAYSGTASANTPPEFSSLTLSNQTSVPAGGTFTVYAGASDPNGDAIRYNLMFSNKHITGGTGFSNVRFTQLGSNEFQVTAPEQLGVWKVYVYAFDGYGNVGIEQKSFRVVPPTIPGTNISQGRACTASTYQPTGTNGPQLPSYATDGNYGTRWASEWVDTAWLQCDLGSVKSFNNVLLAWETASAKSYQIQVSNDGTTWTNIYSTTTGNGGFDQIPVNASGRYIRMNGTARNTAYGYSLWEFQVYQS
ncbi:discoidin domain-containing protein [Catellatospora sp. KI3]|uniref:discoidin domain-containing protein n=1 Tax=Catellatospora sp. KI3 TaxID=3041620 RepID=UPI002482EDCC|nr:discoidin domain-containing protein [Catellatospora sp. KI3]MDI1465332.1 discoidin domain-containing protein [Catellatospora sp. KI3]